MSKLKEEQRNLKEKLQIMKTNATNYRSRLKTPDQMNKKTQKPENRWRNQSRDRYKHKLDKDTDMTDVSTPTSSSETETKEHTKKEYTKKDLNMLGSNQGHYKQPYNKDLQKPAYEKSKYRSQNYVRDNKFLFKPKLIETRYGKHGYNCVPCSSTPVCMD